MFNTVFSNIQTKLKILLDYKVSPLEIIQTLQVFEYSKERFITRLEQMKAAGIDESRLWLLQLSDEMFERYVTLT